MIVEDIHNFDGSYLKNRFAMKHFGYSRTLAIGNIISFNGSLSYRPDKSDSVVAAEDCVNFCLELPRYDTLSGVLFNRLFITNVAQILSTEYLNAPVQVSQNSLIVEKEHKNGGVIQKNGVVSVNLYSKVGDAFLIYLGLYNNSGESGHVRAFSMKLDKEQRTKLMEQVNQSFYFLSNDTFLSTCNVI